MLADEVVGCRLHGRHVERVPDVPGGTGQERIRVPPVEHPVAVGTPRRREAGVEVVAGTPEGPDNHRRPALAVDRPTDPVEVRVSGDVETDDLADRVHSPIRATGARHGDRGTDDTGERVVEFAGNGSDVLVDDEAVEGATVVGDGCPDPHVVGLVRPVRCGPSGRCPPGGVRP